MRRNAEMVGEKYRIRINIVMMHMAYSIRFRRLLVVPRNASPDEGADRRTGRSRAYRKRNSVAKAQ
jgi:hypothetical protein